MTNPGSTPRLSSRALAWRIITQALPILIGQWASVAYGVIDTIMVGHSSPDDLAAMALGASIYGSIFVGLLGFIGALNPIIAQHFGGGRDAEIGKTVMQGVWLSVWLTLLGCIGLLAPDFWLSFSHVSTDTRNSVADYLVALAFALPAALLFRTTYALNTAVSRPKVIMILNLVGLVVKAPLTYALLYGKWGLPALGVAGCGIATAVVLWLECAIMAGVLYFDVFYRRFQIRFAWPAWAAQKELLHLGIPMGLSYFIEVTGFTFMALLVARININSVAAHQILINIATTCYMVPMTLSIAISTLVAQGIGAGDLREARRIALLGVRLALAIALTLVLLIWLLRQPLSTLYTSDAAVAAVALALMPYQLVMHIFDALQTVASFVLRAYKRAVVPMLIYTVALWGIGLFGGYWVAFYPVLGQPLGVAGIWGATAVSLFVAAAALLAYMLRVSSKPLVVQ